MSSSSRRLGSIHRLRQGNLPVKRIAGVLLASLAAIVAAASATQAQQPGAAPVAPPVQGNQNLNVFGAPPPGNGLNIGGNQAPGGGANADFDTLIDLIIGTVENESWQENGTGEGQIQPFPNGVYLDAAGALRVGKAKATLASVRDRGLAAAQSPKLRDSVEATADAEGARRSSELRYVSLPRLEAAIAARQKAHQPLDPSMLTLAGLQRVSFVLAYPETGDLVLAGPAGDWATSREGGVVDAESGRPLVRLDDLMSLWRRQRTQRSAAFGCSITPRQAALARTQEFLAASAAQPLEPGQRRAWLDQLQQSLGQQDVEYFGLDPDTRIAGVLLAADYHMKLVGMGIAPGVPGVKSYLATVRLGPDGTAPPMNILRWWFSMPVSTVEVSSEHNAFALPERCVEVLSENELLAARGERVHTGKSDDLTKQFADSFTAEFAALSDKYPVYGQLQRIFELSLALAVIEKEGLAEKVAWTPTLLVDAERLRLPRVAAVKSVQTVINHKVIGGRKIIAGISGGVRVDAGKSLAVTDAQGASATHLATVRKSPVAPLKSNAEVRWWWD